MAPIANTSAGGPLRSGVSTCSGAMYVGGAEDRADGGQPGRVHGLRDPEVDHFGAGRGEQHVRRLEVPVHQPGGVDRAQRLGELPGQPQLVRPRTAARVDGRRSSSVGPGTNSVASHGRSASGSASSTRAVNIPADRRRGGHLPPEPLPEPRLAGQLVPDDLDRRLRAVRGHAEVDPAHAAGAQPTLQQEATDPLRVAGLQGLHAPGHYGPRTRSPAAPARSRTCGSERSGVHGAHRGRGVGASTVWGSRRWSPGC